MAARSRWFTVFLPLLLAALSLGVYAAGDGWRPDLPWAVVQAKLSSSAALLDVGYDDYKSECFPEFVNYAQEERSNHALTNQVRNFTFMFVCSANTAAAMSRSPYDIALSFTLTTELWSLLTWAIKWIC